MALVQRTSITALAASRQQFFNISTFRPTSSLPLPLNQRHLKTTMATTSPKRNLTAKSGLRDLLTHNNSGGDKQQQQQRVKEKLEFHIHEIRSADPTDATATLKVANLPVNAKPLEWGSSFVFDNEVREGSGAESKLLGRERGWGVVTDVHGEDGLQLMSKISFTDGSYKGSSLTFSGNVGGKGDQYELIVLGGTGHFRGARGYVVADIVPNEGSRFKFLWNVFITAQ